ncbi:uncharacterized protein LOC142340842 [Convolutriloba macropyga]|uniref:uncharacterized protein LOC142340842 n=1 Tax=Convolutriloba macropyga TaxID=536237 RepID=UPI003F51C8B7
MSSTEYKYSPQSFGQPVYYQPSPPRPVEKPAEQAPPQPAANSVQEIQLEEYKRGGDIPAPPSNNAPSSTIVTRSGQGQRTDPGPPSTTSPPSSNTATATASGGGKK